MKLTRLLTLFSVVVLAGFAACSDDEPGVKEQLSFEDEKISLKDANIYITYKSTYEDRLQTKYVITDGTFDTEESEFTGATYNIVVFLYTPEDADSYSGGEYRQMFDLGDAPATAKVSYMLATSETDDMDFRLETPQDQESEPIRVSGGFDDGETITFKFSGDLDSYYYNDNEELLSEPVSAAVEVRGKIKDIESLLVPARKSER